MNTPYIDYYSTNKISPVSQDISDIDKHFARRSGLYLQCGIAPGLLAGKSVIEFGPGSGHNALFTLSCAPASYTFVDGNEFGLQETRTRVSAFAQQHGLSTQLNFVYSKFEEFTSEEKFDLVCCEGAIPLQLDPPKMARRLANFRKIGGIFLLTCCDYVSFLSDTLRKLMGMSISRLLPCSKRERERAHALVPFFSRQFDNLPGMSRPVTDWIFDNVLQPFWGKKLFSINDAISALQDDSVIMGASPNFYTDWRWYKDITTKHNGINKMVRGSYLRNMHNLLDYTILEPERDEEMNQELDALAEKIFLSMIAFQQECKDDRIREVIAHLNDMQPYVANLGGGTVAARLADAGDILRQILDGNANPRCGAFGAFFGRGQQYVSFCRV